MLTARAVHRVGVGEVVGLLHPVIAEALALERCQFVPQVLHQRLGPFRVHCFVIVAGVVVAPVEAPVFAHDLLHGLALDRQQVQPEQDRPETVLLAHVVGAGAKAFLAAQGHPASIQQVAEELPAGGGLEAFHPETRRHPVGGLAGGHGAGDAADPLAVAGHVVGIGGEHRQAVAGGDEEAPAQDHVAVAVAVGGRAEIRRLTAEELLHQVVGMGQVRIRVSPAEVRQGFGAHHRTGLRAQPVLQDAHSIGPGDRVHGIEAHVEMPRVEQGVDAVEVEQGLHQGLVVGHRVDHFDAHLAEPCLSQVVDVHVGDLGDVVARKAQGGLVDGAGDRFRGRPAVGDVVLDAEVRVRAAGVVARREHDAPLGPVLADHAGGGGGGEDPSGAHQDPGNAIGGGHAQDHLDGLAVVVATVAAQHQGAAVQVLLGVEDGLDKVFQVVGLTEYPDPLAQARGTRFLILEGTGLDDGDLHGGAVFLSRLTRQTLAKTASDVAVLPCLSC